MPEPAEDSLRSWAELLSQASTRESGEAGTAPSPPEDTRNSSADWATMLDGARREEGRFDKLEARLNALLGQASEPLDQCVITNCLAVVYHLQGHSPQAAERYCQSAEMWKALDAPLEMVATAFEAMVPLFEEHELDGAADALRSCAVRSRFGPRRDVPLLEPWTDLKGPTASAPEVAPVEDRSFRRGLEIWEGLKRFRWRYWILPGRLVPNLPLVLGILGLLLATGWYARVVYVRHYHDVYRAAQRALPGRPVASLSLMTGLVEENSSVGEPHLYRAAAWLLLREDKPEARELARQEARAAIEKGCPEGDYYLAIVDLLEDTPPAPRLEALRESLPAAYPGQAERVLAWMELADRLVEAGGPLPGELLVPPPSTVPDSWQLRTRALPFWSYLGRDS